MVAIPDDDIANAHGDADPAGALDLGAAHLDRVAVADVVLNCRRKPWRGHFEVDRPGAKTPPQPAEACGEQHHQRCDHDAEALYPAFTGDPSLQGCKIV